MEARYRRAREPTNPLIWLWRKWQQYVPPGCQPSEEQIAAFYWTPEWWEQRQATIKKYGKKCMRCGHTGSEENPIRVDHIKSVRRHWRLRLDPSNLQVLCNDHNMEKGSRDETDYRPWRVRLFGFFQA